MNTSTDCTVPWNINNSNICTNSKDAMKALAMAEYVTNIGIQKCQNWCQSMPMKISEASSMIGLTSSITFYFQSLIPTSTEKNLYTFLSLFAEVGGYTGIMVGYSLMTFSDTLYDYLKMYRRK